MDHLGEMCSVRNSQRHEVAAYFEIQAGVHSVLHVYYMLLAFHYLPHPQSLKLLRVH